MGVDEYGEVFRHADGRRVAVLWRVQGERELETWPAGAELFQTDGTSLEGAPRLGPAPLLAV